MPGGKDKRSRLSEGRRDRALKPWPYRKAPDSAQPRGGQGGPSWLPGWRPWRGPLRSGPLSLGIEYPYRLLKRNVCIGGIVPAMQITRFTASSQLEAGMARRVPTGSGKIESGDLRALLIRSPRRTVSLQINPDLSLVMKAPSDTPEPFLRDFLERRRPWVERHLIRDGAYQGRRSRLGRRGRGCLSWAESWFCASNAAFVPGRGYPGPR